MSTKKHKNQGLIQIQHLTKPEALLNLRQKGISTYHPEKWTTSQLFSLTRPRALLSMKKLPVIVMKTLFGERGP